MPARLRSDPPSTWAAANHVGEDVYYSADPDAKGGQPLVWHWCTAAGRWHCAGTGSHTVNSAPGEALTLAPSLVWPCCGKHGWIREGRWVPA